MVFCSIAQLLLLDSKMVNGGFGKYPEITVIEEKILNQRTIKKCRRKKNDY